MDKNIRNLKRRIRRARNFPFNTCASDRHLFLVAESLLAGRDIEPSEREVVGESILMVLEWVWKTRTEMGDKWKTGSVSR